MISAIVFDFDGVLADSEPLHLRAFQQVLEPLGAVAAARGVLRALSRLRRRRACSRQLRGRADWPLGRATAGGAHRREEPACSTRSIAGGDVLFPGAARVHRAGWRRRCRSASRRARCATRSRRCSRRAGSSDYFRFIVASGETPAEQAGARSVPRRRGAARPAAGGVRRDRGFALGPRVGARRPGSACIGITHTYPRDELPTADAIVDVARRADAGADHGRCGLAGS